MNQQSLEIFVHNLRLKIAEGDMAFVIDQLQIYLSDYSSKFRDEVLLLTSRYNRIRREQRKGTLSQDSAQAQHNQLTQNFLDLFDEIFQSTVRESPTLSISTQPSGSVSRDPFNLFISYSHKDEELRQELNIHLSSLQRQGKIAAWHDREIEAGEEWATQIKSRLESAQIILLLISPPFIASYYCYDIEMQRAITRHDEGTARVIPIILRPCDWKDSPFSKLQALPKEAKPITTWSDRDSAFLDVVQGIRRAVDSLSKK